MMLQAATSKSARTDIPSPYDRELIELYTPTKCPLDIMARFHLGQWD